MGTRGMNPKTFSVGSVFVVQIIPTDSSKAEVLFWFSVVCFWCLSFGDVSPYVCSYYF